MTENLPRIWGWGSRIGKEQKGLTVRWGKMESLSRLAPPSSCILALPCWTEAYALFPSDLVFPALIIVVVVVLL